MLKGFGIISATPEVHKLLLDLHLNSALAHVKLSDWEQAIKSATEALAIDADSKKAKYR